MSYVPKKKLLKSRLYVHKPFVMQEFVIFLCWWIRLLKNGGRPVIHEVIKMNIFIYLLLPPQCFYLVFNPVDLSWPIFTAIFLLGTVGYYIFRSVNRQKDYFRRTNGQAPIWGAMPKYIDATYMSGDGEERKSKLLLSGWWGITRHMNYTGDLMQAAAWCLCCGVGHIFPYYYLVFMLILLIHRCRRTRTAVMQVRQVMGPLHGESPLQAYTLHLLKILRVIT